MADLDTLGLRRLCSDGRVSVSERPSNISSPGQPIVSVPLLRVGLLDRGPNKGGRGVKAGLYSGENVPSQAFP